MTEQTNKVVVTLNQGVDVDAFIDEMSQPGHTSPYVPDRAVVVYNLKPESLRNVDFIMTRDEMELLKQDPRVLDCRWGTKAENGIVIGPAALANNEQIYTRASNYIATGANGLYYDNNWGLQDCYYTTNPFTSPQIIPTTGRSYTLDGKGVDIVIMDSGLQIDHPEFQDANGVSRVQTINWWTAAGQSGSPPWTPDPTQNNMPSGFYMDYDGHGTNVGSIATGKTYGWAKNANIYVFNVIGVSPSTTLPASLGFNLIRLWHQSKPVTSTGYKRPTVVNCSFVSYFAYSSLVTGGNYRGTNWTGNVTSANAVQYGIIDPSGNPYPARVASDDADVIDLMTSGVIVVASAGNNAYEIDIPTGQDYNNYATYSNATVSGNWYYHRGSSPAAATGVVCVGAIDYTYGGVGTYTSANATAKATFSATGARVDLYAPGGYIAGATSNNYSGPYPYGNYYANTAYKQQKDSGTSQASPQVAGVISCVVESNPYFTQSDAQTWIRQNSANNKIADLGANSYSNPYSLQGGNNRYLYMPYQSANPANITGSGTISGPGVHL